MRIVVQKFGGSSLAKADQRKIVAQRIIKTRESGLHPVVVLSAMGRFPDVYATDTLIDLVVRECDGSDVREKDLLMSCGEIISCVLMTHVLRDHGSPAATLTGFQAGILTDENFGTARILKIDPSPILRLLAQEIIAVVAGFQGMTKNFEITTLGRGGSDTTATALGAALRAEYVEIYTDVPGVMTVDPAIYPGAHVIRQLTYMEMGEMANEGAKVLHGRCVDVAQEYKVPIWVKGTFSDDTGTLVSDQMPRDALERQRVVTGLVHVPAVAEVVVNFSSCPDRSGARRALLDSLAREGISLDLINVCYDDLYFIVREELIDRVVEVIEGLGLPHRTNRGYAKISIIGVGMKGTPGVMAKIQAALHDAGVEILRSTDSHITISCLVKREDMVRAIEALHKRFEL